MASLTVFDGAGSIGGNKLYLESEGKGLLLDFGMNFKQMEKFFEEYLRPRSGRGIHDFLALGLVPPLDIFQLALFPSDMRGLSLRELEVNGLLLSHAHMDHAGCIGLLKREIPIYCTPMSAAILKAHRDVVKSELGNEIVYFAPREPFEKDDRVLRASRQANFVGRDFFLLDEPSRELKEFWASAPGGRGLDPGALREIEEPPLPINGFEVDHSIYGAAAFAVETDAGWVVYTGDLRLHGERGEKTEEFVKEASGLDPKVLVIEGTRIGEEKGRAESESDVYAHCLSAVQEEKGLVVADFSPRNFERLETFIKVARETGRHLLVLAKDAYMLDAVKAVDGKDRMENVMIYQELREEKFGWEASVRGRFGEKFVDPREVAEAPGNYILCFSFWDIKHLLDIRPEGGLYIYSSSEAHNEEDVFDFKRLWRWLQLFDIRTRGFQMARGRPVFEPGFHASGHASAEELVELVNEIGPKLIVPIHTEHPSFFRKTWGRKAKILKNGEALQLS